MGGRPTVLWALALEGLKDNLRDELIALMDADSQQTPYQRVNRVRQLYFEAGVFETAYALVEKHQQKAEEIADSVESDELRRLLYYLVDTVLDRTEDVKPTIEIKDLSFQEVLPIVSGDAK